MAKKKKRPQTQRPATPAEPQPQLSAEERAARRTQQKEEWARQKQGEERAASQSFAPILLAGGVVATLVVVAVLGFVIFSGGGSSSSSPTPGPTVDPRIGGAAPVETFAVSATDSGVDVLPRFEPSSITAKAGEVFEIDVKNTGSSVHNLVVDGNNNGQFDDAGDFISDPSRLQVGDSGKVLVKLNAPGTYNFHCDFHPDQQKGTLTILPAASGSATATTAASLTPTASQ